MIRVIITLLAASLCIASMQLNAANSDHYLTLQQRIIDITKEKKSAVVTVYASFKNKDEKEKPILLSASGFFISKEGLILTNAKVTAEADRIWIEYDGKVRAAESVGQDLVTNISVIRAPDLQDDFTFINLNFSSELPEIGAILISVARQHGFPPSPTMGLVTGHDTKYMKTRLPTVYIRTNIPSGTGESGSPIFNLNGKLVGISLFNLSDIRSSFILPVKAIKRVINDIIFSGEVKYALFGLFTKINNDLNNPAHLAIDKIVAHSPASKINLKVGDVLLKIGRLSNSIILQVI